MNRDLQLLIHLQELDSSAEQHRRRVTDIPILEAALDARLAERTAAVDAVKARIAASQAARREIEKDLAAVQGRLSKFKNQLMEVKTNKEYQAMQKEMSVAEQEISEQETKMLERMEEADVLALELKAAESALKSEEADIASARQKLDAERGQVDEAVTRTAEERARVAAQVSQEALALFERIAHGRKGQAMAEARDGLCTVCHVRLRPQVFNEARRNEQLIQCDSCTRILYFVPAQAPAASQPS
ncbi:MAG: zinc ribbon domain-containing protein [Vicinamibacterales bacterium]